MKREETGFVSMHSLLVDSRFVLRRSFLSCFYFYFYLKGRNALRVCLSGHCVFEIAKEARVGWVHEKNRARGLMGIAGSEFILRNGG